MLTRLLSTYFIWLLVVTALTRHAICADENAPAATEAEAISSKKAVADAAASYFKMFDHFKYSSLAEVHSDSSGAFTWSFDFTGSGSMYSFRKKQIPRVGSSVTQFDERIANDGKYLQYFNGRRLRIREVPAEGNSTSVLTRKYIRDASVNFAAMLLPWYFVTKNSEKDINNLTLWESGKFLSEFLTAAKTVSLSKETGRREITFDFANQPGIFVDSQMHFSAVFSPDVPFPVRWSFLDADGSSGIVYEVTEIGEATAETTKTVLKYPRQANWSCYAGDKTKPYSKTKIVIQEMDRTAPAEDDFTIDPAMAEDVMDLDKKMRIVVPK